MAVSGMALRASAAMLLIVLLGWSTSAAAISEAQARAAGEAAVQKIIPRKIDYHGLRLKFLPFGASVKDVTISESRRYEDHPLRDWQYFTTARRADLTVDLMPLLVGRISLNQMNVQGFQVNLLIDKDYGLNVTDMFQERGSPLMKWLKVRSFRASGGTVRVRDASAARGPADLTFTEVEAVATNFAIKEKFNGAIHLRTPGAATRNVSMRGTAGPILDADRVEQVPFNGVLTVDKAPLPPFSPYIPDGLTAYPEGGTATVKLQGGGNLWDGATGKGHALLENIVLASPDGKTRGKPFDLGVDIGEVQLSLKRDAIDIKAVSVTLGTNRIGISGTISKLFDNPLADINITGPEIDLPSLEAIYPFVRAMLPKGLAYAGKVGVNIHANGTSDAMAARGVLDVAGLGVLLDDVFEKKQGSPLKVNFNANLKPTELKMTAQADVSGSDVVLLNARVFRDGLKLAINDNARQKNVDATLRVQRVLTASTVSGALRYENGLVSLDKFAAIGLRDADGVLGDAWVTGVVDLGKRTLKVEVTALLSDDRSRRLQGPHLASTDPGRVQYRFRVEGNIDSPGVHAAGPATLVRAAAVSAR